MRVKTFTQYCDGRVYKAHSTGTFLLRKFNLLCVNLGKVGNACIKGENIEMWMVEEAEAQHVLSHEKTHLSVGTV